MPAPVVEVVSFIPNEAYKQDRSAIHPALEILQGRPGCLGIWHGLQAQDASFGYIVVLWETLEHHLAYIADTAEHAKLDVALERVGELLGLYHVRFPTDVSPALDAPTTEIAVWALAPGTDRAAGRAAAVEVVRMIHEDMQEDVLGGALGDIVEDERRVSVILGWHSVERFNAAFLSNQRCAEGVAELKKQGEVEAKLAHLEKFKTN